MASHESTPASVLGAPSVTTKHEHYTSGPSRAERRKKKTRSSLPVLNAPFRTDK